jgi:hypothetical protein
MNPIAKGTQTSKDLGQLKTRLKTTWMAGDYDPCLKLYGEGRGAVFPAARRHTGNPAA